MKLKFIVGPSGSGKTTYMTNEILSKSMEFPEKNIICIVPEQFTLQSERNLIRAAKSKTLIKIQVLSFKRLAYHIFSELGRSEKPLLDDISKSILLRKVLNDISDELNYFNKSICSRKGFIEKISKTVSEFFQYCITEAKLNSFAAKNEEEGKNDDTSLKLRDISLIYSKYLEYLNKSYISADETLNYLSQKLSDSSFLKDSLVYIDGFNGFTPQQFNVIERLLNTAEAVAVALTLSEPVKQNIGVDCSDPFYDSKKTVKRLTQLVKENNITVEPYIFLKENMRHKANNELAFLEKNYFSYPAEKYNKQPENISVRGLSNKYAEIKNAASHITYLVKQKNYKYSDIAVIYPGDEYTAYLTHIFDKYNIPYFTDVKKNICSHPLTRLICSVLDIIIYNYSYEAVFGYIKTGFLAECEKYDVTSEELNILENYVLSNGITGRHWQQDMWIYGFGEKSKFNSDSINKTKTTVIKSLEPLRLKNTKNYSVKDIAFCLMDFLTAIDAAKTLESRSLRAEQTDSNTLIRKENIQVWKNITEIISSTVSILGEAEMTVSEYADILNSAFENSTAGFVPSSQDQVIIGDFGRTRLPEIKALLILNVNDGILPAAKNDISFISDAERELLKENGIELAPDSKILIAQDEFIAYSTLTKPYEQLYLSYSLVDSSANEIKPSLIIDKITDIFPKLNISLDFFTDNNSLGLITSPEPVFEELIGSLKSYKSDNEPSDIFKDAYLYFIKDKSYSSKLEALKKGLFKLYPAEKLDAGSIKLLYPKKTLSLSVSRLEAFKKCPFSYFMKYGLNIYPREKYEIGSLEIGNFYHSVMENFSRLLTDENINWHKITKEEIIKYIDEAIEKSSELKSSLIFYSTPKYVHYIEKIRRSMLISAIAVINSVKEGKYNPYGFEFSLRSIKTDENNNPIEESKSFLKPVEIRLDNGYKILLTGKIDRIDILDSENKAYIKIIDYKSSKHAPNLQLIYLGAQMQLLMYLDAFIKVKKNDPEFAEKILEPGGVFYFEFSDPVFKALNKKAESDDIIGMDNFKKYFKQSGFVNSKKENLAGLSKNTEKIEYEDIKKASFDYISPTFFSEENLKHLMEYVNLCAADCAKEMINGNISIFPLVPDDPCKYCSYESICTIDAVDKKNYGSDPKRNNPPKLKDFEYINKIREKLGAEPDKNNTSSPDKKLGKD